MPSSGSTTSRMASSRSSIETSPPFSAAGAGGSGIPAAPRTDGPRRAVRGTVLGPGDGVLERHPPEQRALHAGRVAGDAGERDAVAEHVLVRLDQPAALRHLLERGEDLAGFLDRPADDE